MANSCAFTGHRNMQDLDYALLDRVVENLIKTGCKRFLCGMARGFDLAAAESVIALKAEYPDLSLVACIPYGGQEIGLSIFDRARYKRILENCSEVLVLSEEYYHGCLHVRDRFMIDNSEVVVCYLRTMSGGTYYTVEYARSLNRKVIEL